MVDHFFRPDGPACARCGGSSWRYTFSMYGVAECEGCGMSEGPLRLRDGEVLPWPEDSEGALSLHLLLHESLP